MVLSPSVTRAWRAGEVNALRRGILLMRLPSDDSIYDDGGLDGRARADRLADWAGGQDLSREFHHQQRLTERRTSCP